MIYASGPEVLDDTQTIDLFEIVISVVVLAPSTCDYWQNTIGSRRFKFSRLEPLCAPVLKRK